MAALALIAATGNASAIAATPHLSLDYNLDAAPPAVPAQNELDVYAPDAPGRHASRPVIVYVHGGAWATGDKGNQIDDKVDLFTRAGYVFVSVNYRLSPTDPTILDPSRIKFPNHPHDVGEALGWLNRHISEYGGDPTRMALIGHSAGAHLVSLVSTDPSYVEAYGVKPWRLIGTVSLDTDAFDVPSRIAELAPRRRDLYYNAFGTPAENAATGSWAAGSPINFAGPEDPDFLLVTQQGNAARIAENQRMAAALGQGPAGIFLAPYDHQGINDAVGDPNDTSGETQAIMDFFTRAVREARAPVARLTRHPKKLVRTRQHKVRVTFGFRSNLKGSAFRCRLDARRFRLCISPRSYRVRPKRHTFELHPLAPSGRPGKVKSFHFRVMRRTIGIAVRQSARSKGTARKRGRGGLTREPA